MVGRRSEPLLTFAGGIPCREAGRDGFHLVFGKGGHDPAFAFDVDLLAFGAEAFAEIDTAIGGVEGEAEGIKHLQFCREPGPPRVAVAIGQAVARQGLVAHAERQQALQQFLLVTGGPGVFKAVAATKPYMAHGVTFTPSNLRGRVMPVKSMASL